MVRGQDVEEEINCPRYLIGATGEGATKLLQDPEDPLPLRRLIFLKRDHDICAWLLANNGHDSLDLMVLESRPEDGDDVDETPEPPDERYLFSTTTSGMNGPVLKMRRGRCRRRMSGLTRMNGYRPSKREQLGRLLVQVLSLWTTER